MSNKFRYYLLSLILLCVNSSYAIFKYPLTVFSEENGGIEHNVWSTVQDKHGFLWVATNNGLCRYDGNSFKIYQNNPLNKKTLASSRVIAIQEDNNNQLWISIEKMGIAKYSYLTDDFKNYTIIDKSQSKTSTNDIIHFVLSSKNEMWAVTSEEIMRLKMPDNQSDNFVLLQSFKTNIPNSIRSKNLRIVQPNDGLLFVSTPIGLMKLQKNKAFNNYSFDKQFQDTNIKAVYCDKNKNIWIVTDFGFYITQDGIKFTKQSIPLTTQNKPASITQDRYENYILKYGNQLFKWKNANFSDFTQLLISDNRFFDNNFIFGIIVDSSNNLWLSSANKGLGKIDLEAKAFKTLPIEDPQNGSILNDIVRHLLVDSNHYLWISTKSTGLIVTDLNGKYESMFFRSKSAILQSSTISSTFEDSKKRIWVCCKTGLYIIDGNPFSGKIKMRCISDHKNYPQKYKSLILSVNEDNLHRFWITTGDGYICITENANSMDFKTYMLEKQSLKSYNDPTRNLLHFYSWSNGIKTLQLSDNQSIESKFIEYDKNDISLLASSHIWSILRASDSILWIGTDCGLYSLRPKSEHFTHISQIGEYQNPRILSILEDLQKNLWLNTTGGLICWNPNTNSARKYDVTDGFIQNSLNEAACKDRNGVIYIAGFMGVKYFMPSEIKTNAFKPHVIITQLALSNKNIQVGDTVNGRILLKKSLFLLDKIKLKYYENNITFEFASLHFNNPLKNKCAYKLEGYDKEWITTQPNQRFATYNSLPSGSYTFLVKARNNDGVWNEEPASLKVNVSSAPWNTFWAYLLYFAIILWLIYRYYIYVQLKRKMLIEHLERQKETEINEGKMQFFVELTHELRTPLTLIVSPIQELLSQSDLNEFSVQRLNTVKKSSERLLRLVNKYLDLSKIDRNEYPFIYKKRDLISDLNEFKKTFDIHAIQKKINYQIQSECEELVAWYDKEKLEIIIINLLSNAFKFTPEGGDIHIFVDRINEEQVSISIRDTGFGIDQDQLNKIFAPFYQIGEVNSLGTGIGLTLSKKLIELHHGQIKAFSKKGEGSQFTVIFPIDRSSYPEEDIFEDTTDVETDMETQKSENSKMTILIVEDDKDVQDYLKMMLAPNYNILLAGNGNEGKKMALQYIPDLILMDITMPKMNGIELTNILKNDIKTTHIPIIIITGNDGHQLQKDAYEKGIHDWIQKPFVSSILLLKVSNILKSRKQLSENEIKTKIEKQQDEGEKQFLKVLIEIIEKHIDDVSFGVDQLADSTKMSRMQLHRKLMATVGKSSSELIKEIRLNKAKELIASGKYNISEVYYHVGFSSHSYFTKVFKEFFGVLPSEIKW